MMYSTKKNTCFVPPSIKEDANVGKWLVLPDETGGRLAEGGMRTKSIFKQSLPDMPLVTIITVCLNSAKTIEQTISSVLKQTYSNIEYIIVDGGSSDDTLALLKKHEDVIDYYVSEPDSGLYYAMNKGLELASGDYILLLNSDDWYSSDCVEKLVKAKSYSGCDFVGALAQYIDENDTPSFILRSMPYDASCLFRMPLRHETLLISSKIYNEIGLYDLRYKIISDRQLVQCLYLNGYTYYEVSQALLHFRTSGVSNKQRDKLVEERKFMLKSSFNFIEEEDIAVLGDTKLIPGDVYDGICRKYVSYPILLKTLRAYFEDCKVFEFKLWREISIDWQKYWKLAGLPEISIILPIYNAEKKLPTALDSILAQTFINFEIVCVNDQSPDNSQKVIDQYCQIDDRIRPLVNEKNLGHGGSRNRGIRAARGIYIFHIDPDDTLPANALASLRTHDSQLVKGAFSTVDEAGVTKEVRRPCGITSVVENANLTAMPQILNNTSGHWSILYDRNIAEAIPYPTDLKMGQDSIFLVNLYSRARSITLIPDIVYNYHFNTESAMNTFTAQKYYDELRWRLRAWHVLWDYGHQNIGDYLLQAYWYEPYVRKIPSLITKDEQKYLISEYRAAFREAGLTELTRPPESEFLKTFFNTIMQGNEQGAFLQLNGGGKETAVMQEKSIKKADNIDCKVGFFNTTAAGGAGNAAVRLAHAVRSKCEDVKIYNLFRNDQPPHIRRVRARADVPDPDDLNSVKKYWAEHVITPALKQEQCTAQELFSLTHPVVDWTHLKEIFQTVDVVHMHWVAGMFDYAHAQEYASDIPIIWTLHDMNPFTGGCHYSEGCEKYKNECRDCPLLRAGSDRAHKEWQIKKEAYKKIKNLHIVTPSQWLADCAKESSLLGDRPIHCIANILPPDVFSPTDSTVARIRLGLPLRKKLLLFGADSLENKRKGGDLLEETLIEFQKMDPHTDVEVILFGRYCGLKLPVKVRYLGHISDEKKLALIYSAADALVFPSREDNAPLMVGEALLCGTPIVAFPVGNVPDLIKHGKTGYLADYLNPKSLADGIKWVFKDNAESAISRRVHCRISATEFYNPAESIKQHIELYSSALAMQKDTQRTRKTNNRIYVVTPCLNMVDTIDETIKSVVSQGGDFSTYYRVQDGGSTDGTVERLKYWENKLEKLKTGEGRNNIHFSWVSEKDSGMYDALKKGVEALNPGDNEFIGWINADDSLLHGALSKILTIAVKRSDISWVGSHTYNIKENGALNCSRPNPTPTIVISEGLCDGYDRHWFHLQQEGTFFRKTLWDKCKHVLNNFKYAGDWALWREFAKNSEYYQCSQPLGAFRIREGQISTLLRDKYDAEIEAIVSLDARDNSFKELYEKRRSLYANVITISDDECDVTVTREQQFVRDTFFVNFKKFPDKSEQAIKNVTTGEPKKNTNLINPANFNDFTYALRSHWRLFDSYSEKLFGEVLNSEQVDLKRYQDLLAYAYIRQNFPKGSKLLEVGGGISRLLNHFSSDYECWNVDKLEGMGNGPKDANLKNVHLVRDYIGNFNTKIPENYFDFVFSISVLEHVPQDDETVFQNIIDDINRILKPGGYSLHLFDIVFKGDGPREFSKLIRHIFNNVPTINKFVEPEVASQNSDLYYLTKETYEKIWFKYTKRSYEDFGRPTNLSVLWKK